jgi:N-acetylmuramoyl-L-alanine amidase
MGVLALPGVLRLAVCVLVLVGAADPPANRFDTVVLDAGHGGEDEGAVSPAGVYEKDLVLDISKRLSAELRRRQLAVVLTRDTDRFVSLEERTSLANDVGGDLFVSIHANASRSRLPRGSETFFVSLEASDEVASELAERENMAFGVEVTANPVTQDPLLALLSDLIATEHVSDSSDFARLAQSRLATVEGLPSRGVKQAPFVVLMGVQMPAALVEIGFLTNRDEARSLSSSKTRHEMALALAEAVLEFGRRYDARRGIDADQSLVRGGD